MPGAAGRRWKGSHSRRCTPGHAPSNWHRAENSPVVTGHVLRAMFGLTLTEPDDPKAVRLGIEGVSLGEYTRPRWSPIGASSAACMLRHDGGGAARRGTA